ncbi:hypothetical protein FKW77_007657 [Venturia effusa]|uniref:Heterokaryon incompatibility domain-containing protein n=1 Tax=Venturia effusa TaxID=50376 RepID=A0A517L3P6_9PEZI|nr:hypothetical protein FKW77_007657 [Venturia effusa]
MEPGALVADSTQRSIPNTIIDAISVVRQLGECYLWVDSLCLLQDDKEELKECTSIMDLFYEMALLTIVAGSGDAWSGLPGVAPTPRGFKPTKRRIKPDLALVVTSPGLDVLLRRSVYSSRAWTMQEELLSRRLLVFINGQVYFRCPEGEISEERNWALSCVQSPTQMVSVYSQLLTDSEGAFDQFALITTYYTSRSLSYQNDILRAIYGMLHKLTIISGLHCFEGLLAPLDRSLLFSFHRSKRRNLRREGFPTYSWTSWTSMIYYHPHEGSYLDDYSIRKDSEGDEWQEDHDLVLRRWIIWHCVSDSGKMYRIDGSGRLRKNLHLKAEETRANTRRVFRDITILVSDIDFMSVRATKHPLLLFWTICVNVRLSRMTRPGVWESELDIQFAAIDDYNRECGSVQMSGSVAHDDSSVQVALICQRAGIIWGIVLKWNNDVAERCGIAKLSANITEVCLAPGPRWKAIVLVSSQEYGNGDRLDKAERLKSHNSQVIIGFLTSKILSSLELFPSPKPPAISSKSSHPPPTFHYPPSTPQAPSTTPKHLALQQNHKDSSQTYTAKN